MPIDPTRWQQAASLAARAHRHALRKDGRTPYYAHPTRVALTVAVVFGCDDEVALCAALLHDTVEDTDTDYDDLLEAFGPEVADAVAALTKNMILREDLREPEYDARLAAGPWQARLVKLADQYDNLSELDNRPDAPPGSAKRAQTVERARRAIALARTDAHRDCVVRGIDAVTRLLAGLRT
ncbi:MAG: bifunctional (p)ppGpp synthetase/guanosine-3',5'-bis(diphosphate) 3'-pyrophosphohydrolase [Phycisphaeraceae bacterium]|nr:bifunctional (p)ppGpp synthetase/guanosine-3',5'-bis(diphosphate) 3'-pyrophosphohydrolase [Phycisphaeraceae bacterium]